MTNEIKKTAIFAGVSLVLVATAWWFTRPRVVTAEAFSDQGEVFFPEFKDPQLATALEVIGYDPETAKTNPFKVAFEDKKGWVIPSHNDYPADGKDRLAKTAAGAIDLKKEYIVSDNPEQHAALEVVDPLDTKSTEFQGLGKRLTLRDKTGKALADLIIGKAVPGRDRQRYVRVPGQKRTYAVTLPEGFELSPRFADWIETNLLKLDTFALKRITIDNHKVDPELGTVDRGDVVTLERKDSSAPWTLDDVPADRELDTGKVSTLTSALADLKISGVRPKPPGLTAELKAQGSGEGNVKLSNDSIRSLASRGFYLTRDGQLLSNQGDVIVATNEGVVYILRFGEVTFATGNDLSAGSEDEGTPDAAKKDETKKDQVGTESRYLFVTAQFEPDLIPRPEAPKAGGELPDKAFQRTNEEIKKDEDDAKQKQADYDRKVADGKKKAQELTDRFANWYYVVPGTAFRSIVLDRNALTRVKGAPGADIPPGGAPGGLPPSFPGLPGIPQP